VADACILTDATEFNFLSGVTTSDADGDTVTVTYTVTPDPIVFGETGTYTITYTANDGTTTTSTSITLEIDNDCDDGGTGGGDPEDPSITFGDLSCIADGTVSDFDFLNGVTAIDSLGDALTLTLEDNVTGEELVDFNTVGSYEVTYTFTDPFNFEVVTEVRTIVISDRCSTGGSSSSGSSRHGGSSNGEILGASSCVQFTTYNRQGNTGGEIMALQLFLNGYMDAGLTVDGVYGRTTTQAVHDFQAFHWSEIIDPWTPPLSPNTTGWEYKTTRATINAIMDCPEAPVFLEDPATIFSITEVEGQKEFTDAQIAEVSQLLALAQILGAATDASNVNNSNSNTSSNIVYNK
jgi:peptidoglycan hydrolase-like protein with peptidoglycan-binding domain